MTTTGTMTLCTGSASHGANLQAYALQRILQEAGHPNEIIHFERQAQVFNSHRSLFWLVRHKTWKTISDILPMARDKSRRTQEFRARNLVFSKDRYSDENILMKSPPEYNTYLTGSDQVWNPRYVAKHASTSPWFLSFVPSGRKRISYAASFGISRLPKEDEERYRRWLNEMDHLSTRESEGQEIIKRLTGRDAELHVDPTLLLSAEEWSTIATPFAMRKPYILCFYMPGFSKVNRVISSMAWRLSLMTGWKIVTVGLKDYWILNPFVHGVFDAGPAELVGLIEGASFVFTNSFHGAAFSVIFERPFLVPIDTELPPEKALHSRITNLMRTLKLQNRVVDADRYRFSDTMLDIDWGPTQVALQEEKARAGAFLKNALKEA